MTDMTKHREARGIEKSDAIAAIERALSIIESENREPAQWERAKLLQAVSWLYRGGYRIAEVEAALALTPKDKRSEDGLMSDEVLERCNIETLRTALKRDGIRFDSLNF